MYELSFAHFAKKDYEKSLEVAQRGARYKSRLLPRFYIMIGNSLDDLGRRDDAIAAYKAGIKLAPEEALLHFNLGLSQMRSGKYDEAKKALQRSMSLNPNHASSHFVLAGVYQKLGYRVPAILALSRFLLLEPSSPRTKDAMVALDRMIGGGVTKGKQANQINITLSLTPAGRKDEGDFDSVELAMSMSLAASQMEGAKKESSKFRMLAATYAVMADVMSRMKRKGFAASYYAPFFADMDKRELVEAFVDQGFRAAQIEGSEDWRKANEGKLREFQAWLVAYKWPTLK